jgi:hypothetical protein
MKSMQITYLPYLSMGRYEEAIFKPLNVRVWNYARKSTQYIPDITARTAVDALMATNVAHGRSINDMGIISVSNFDLREYTPEEKALCKETALLLFVGSLARGGVIGRGANAGHYVSTTENFTVVEQNFVQEGDRIATQDGYVVNIRIGGYKISEVKFGRPDYTPAPLDSNGDGRIIDDLLKMRAKQKRIYRRLMRAIDMFKQAYYNDTKLSQQSRIMLITSAYEILFDLPESGQRARLKENFRQLFVMPTDIKRRYKSERGSGRPSVWEIDSIKVMWADKFYTLRNKIIHGSPLKPADFVFCDKQRHFDIAVLFFVLGLKKIMGNTSSVAETADQIVWEKHEDPDGSDGEENYEGFVYEKLGPLLKQLRG